MSDRPIPPIGTLVRYHREGDSVIDGVVVKFFPVENGRINGFFLYTRDRSVVLMPVPLDDDFEILELPK